MQKNIVILYFLFSLFPTILLAQNRFGVEKIEEFFELDEKKYTVQHVDDESFIVRDNGDSLFLVIVERMPEFIGGQQELFKFLGSNMVYPKKAKEKGIEGTIHVRFVVNKEGIIEDVHVIKGGNILLKDEAERVVKLMPKWIPGYQKGKAVSVYYDLPIKFTLKKDKKKRNK